MPAGGYTKYLSLEDLEEEKRQKQRETPFMQIKAEDAAAKEKCCFEEVGLLARLCISLAGPATLVLVAIALMSCSVFLGADQLALSTLGSTLHSEQTTLRPTGIVGLQLKPEPATWVGHYELASSVARQIFAKFLLFQRLDGWGGFLGWQVTGGTILLRSFSARCTFVGLMALFNGLFCLMPIGVTNGFLILLGVHARIFGKSGTKKYLMRYAVVRALFQYVVAARILYADVAWITRAVM